MSAMRKILLGSFAMVAAATVVIAPAAAQQQQKPNIVIIWGDDIGQSEHQRLLARRDGLQDAQHRPRREGRDDVHRLLCRAELHRRPGLVHHRPVTACAPA